MRHKRWSWLAAAVVVSCAVIETGALADRSRGEPRNGDLRRYVLGEIYDPYRVEQRFFVKANGLSSVTVHPRPASPGPTGTVTLQLRDVTDGQDHGVVYRESSPLASMVEHESVALAFPPQPSVHREYALDVIVEGSSDGQGIGLLATRGEGYRGGAMFINGRQRFGDLVFETTVTDAMSNFSSIASVLGRSGVPAPRIVLTLILLLKSAALFVLIRYLARAAAASPTLAGLPAPSP